MINPNVGFWLERRYRLQPHNEAIVYWHQENSAERWTYGRLQSSVNALVAWLVESGVGAGDRVALLDFNDARFAVTMFAAARIGAVFVPLNFRLVADEIVDIVNDCEPSVLIHGDGFESVRHAVAASTACRRFLRSSRDDTDELGPLLDTPDVPAVALHDSGWDEPAWLLYTSGSTGRPKGVLLSHGNLFWNTLNIVLAQGGFATDRVLISAPLFHAAPVSTFMDTFLRGATIHLERDFDAGRILQRIEDEQITVVAGVPAMYKLMAGHAAFDACDLRSLRALVVGGAPVPEALIEIYRARGVAVVHRYGLTEASVLVTALPRNAPPEKQMSAGLAPLFSDVRIVDQDGIPVGPGIVGEVEACGPNIMQGYWKREADTESVMRDGWLRTGDLGRLDEDGYLTVAGRSKDMIISGGENVYAAEVEARLVDNPGILEAAVIGVPDPKWGETVCAILSVRENHELTSESVLAHLQGRLARYKQPRKIIFVEMLPKNGSGKIDKRLLRAKFGSPTTV